MTTVPIIPDEFKSKIGQPWELGVYEIEKGMVRRFARAIDDPSPPWETMAPPTFIVTLGGQRIYHAGDTDNIPEMENLQADIALLPVSGTYVMTAEEAADAARRIAPRVAIPMHYGAGVAGTRADAERFAELYGGQVLILEQE